MEKVVINYKENQCYCKINHYDNFNNMRIEMIKNIIKDRYEGIIEKKAYGETIYFYNPEGKLKNGVNFFTIKENDGPSDSVSNLNREGVYRISTGLDRESYEMLFGNVPERARRGSAIELKIDFQELNKIMPHPIYAWMGWISINNPTEASLKEFLNYIDLGYEKVKEKYKERIKKEKVA